MRIRACVSLLTTVSLSRSYLHNGQLVGVRAFESLCIRRRNGTVAHAHDARCSSAASATSTFTAPALTAVQRGINLSNCRRGARGPLLELSALRDASGGPPGLSSANIPAVRPPAPLVPRKRVLILMSDTGGGHRASAEALKAAFVALYGEKVHVDIVDIWTDYGKPPFSKVVQAYRYLGRHPKLWKFSYEYGRFPPSRKLTELWTNILCFKGFKRCFEEYEPDLIVSVHPLCHYLPLRVLEKMGRAKGEGKDFGRGRRVPYVTVVTDLGSAHPTWFDPRVDRVYVPSNPLERTALRCGVSPDRLRQFGLPTRPAFWGVKIDDHAAEAAPAAAEALGEASGASVAAPAAESVVVEGVAADKAAARRRLGLAEGLPTVLLVGGGDGFGRLRDIAASVAERLATDLPASQMVVVAGNNKKLRAQLQELPWPKSSVTVAIQGFVGNMDEWMTAADVLVTKAGPGTIAEACTKGLPLVLSSYLPGQEKGNVALVTEGGFGVYTKRPRRIAATVSEWLRDPAKLAAMGDRARAQGRPTATLDIARDITEGVLGLTP